MPKNIVDYFELGSPDPESTKAFYSGLFEWEVGAPSPGSYRSVNDGGGGLWDTSEMGSGTWAIFYVHVEDVKATIVQAEALGATVAVPFVDNGQIEFAHLIDPNGNRFGVWRPKTDAGE